MAAEAAHAADATRRVLVHDFLAKLDTDGLVAANTWLDERCDKERENADAQRIQLAEVEKKEAALLDVVERCGQAVGALRLLDEIESRERWREVRYMRYM